MPFAPPPTDFDNDIRTPPLVGLTAPDGNLEEGNTADDDRADDLKLHGVNPNVTPVRAAVLAAKDVMLRNALDGVANVASVLEIPPSVRTAVDTGRLEVAMDGIL
mmetsp:Transcript_21033/g.34481  ORF Transcript_21033/g.34481 Transcript_21033/m.34481 type:complete len:105 (-) Transcript_21033:864-1178(-)